MRRAALARAQSEYVYNHQSRLEPLGVASRIPLQEDFSPILMGTAALESLELLGNVLVRASRTPGRHGAPGPRTQRQQAGREETHELLSVFERRHRQLSALLARFRAAPLEEPLLLAPRISRSALLDSGAAGDERRPPMEGQAALTVPGTGYGEIIRSLFQRLQGARGKRLLKALDLVGFPDDVYRYAALFQTLRLPEIASNYRDDLTFAWMRVAGPNPLVITRLADRDPRLAVTEAHYRSVMGLEDDLTRAREEGRLYLADYSVLSELALDTAARPRKYLEAPLALFAVPPDGARDRQLRAIGIRCSTPGGEPGPLYTPSDGAAWLAAKIHVQVADANHHELISHLGGTHLLLEAFAMATPRQLAPWHPLYVLLKPHLEGTLAINDAAERFLLAPEGPVDRLLPGTLASSIRLAVDSVRRSGFNRRMLPAALARRGVADDRALPGYPYRDDARLLWDAIHSWARDYLAIYYRSDADVQGDGELQSWLSELTSPDGGGLDDIGEDGAMRTRSYLADVVTMIIFTASAQHAAVNFPQSSVMSFAPAMPLAAYAPGPSHEGASPGAETRRLLPPLEKALLQQLVLHLLGSIYYTRLGDYNRHIAGEYFTDPRVMGPLASFHERLRDAEETIGRRNLGRVPYLALLPTSIPQSTNI